GSVKASTANIRASPGGELTICPIAFVPDHTAVECPLPKSFLSKIGANSTRLDSSRIEVVTSAARSRSKSSCRKLLSNGCARQLVQGPPLDVEITRWSG